MKRLLILFIACMLTLPALSQTTGKNHVEVIYFHGKQRCLTCRDIEKYTKELIDTEFADHIKNGDVRFRQVDISTDEGEKLAGQYRVTWSSLYVNRWHDGKEERHDMTQFGFKNARNNTRLFKEELKQTIEMLLK